MVESEDWLCEIGGQFPFTVAEHCRGKLVVKIQPFVCRVRFAEVIVVLIGLVRICRKAVEHDAIDVAGCVHHLAKAVHGLSLS